MIVVEPIWDVCTWTEMSMCFLHATKLPKNQEHDRGQRCSGPTLRDLGVKLTKSPLENDSIYLEASVDRHVQDLTWRWYVDDGVLIKTGRTSTQGSRNAIPTWEDINSRTVRALWWTDNIWELPKAPGRYRAVVIASGWYMPGNETSKGGKDDWGDDKSSPSEGLYLHGSSNPSQTWAIVEVEVK